MFFNIVKVGGGVLDRVVQHGCRQRRLIVHAKDVAHRETDAKGMADIRRFAVLTQLMPIARAANAMRSQQPIQWFLGSDISLLRIN